MNFKMVLISKYGLKSESLWFSEITARRCFAYNKVNDLFTKGQLINLNTNEIVEEF